MATTLKQFWTDDVARLNTRLTALATELTALRAALTAAQATQTAASNAVTAQAKAVDDARKALAGIPMPADGSPLLVAMEQALMNLADARADLATATQDVLGKSADLTRLQAQQTSLQAALADANKLLTQAGKNADQRQKWVDALTTGSLSTLVADATAALANEATARSRVEGEFPSSGTAAKDFLTRARARRALPQSSLTQAAATETTAFNAHHSALAQAQRAFDAAADAVRQTFEAAPRLAADGTVLARLAALPAASPPNTYPILTRWQHDRLHDAAKKTDRENALAKLKDVDDAAADVRTAQASYDAALHAAMKADPDKTPAQLDTGAVSAEKTTLTTKQGTLATKRAALTADEVKLVKSWLAAVPDTLWDALDSLDTAATRLKALVGPPTPANLVASMTAAETALVTALTADRLAQRKLEAAALAAQRAAGLLAAERDSANARSLSFEHGATLF